MSRSIWSEWYDNGRYDSWYLLTLWWYWAHQYRLWFACKCPPLAHVKFTQFKTNYIIEIPSFSLDWTISWFLFHLLWSPERCDWSKRSLFGNGDWLTSHTCRLLNNTTAPWSNTGHLQRKSECSWSWTWSWPKSTSSPHSFTIATSSSSSPHSFTGISFTIILHPYNTIFDFTLFFA